MGLWLTWFNDISMCAGRPKKCPTHEEVDVLLFGIKTEEEEVEVVEEAVVVEFVTRKRH